MIRFEHVSKTLGGRTILRDVNFEVNKGETFVIVGPSGAGKSVTLKHMVRLLTPDAGNIVIDGEDVTVLRQRELERVRRKFGYLFQGGALLAWLTLGENVALPLREKGGLDNDEIHKLVIDSLDRVGLADDIEKRPDEISGGMRKRVGLARALITNPAIVLYDEPTSGLDPVTSRTIDALIDQMREDLGVTGVVVTHDLHSALSIGTRIAMLHGGGIIEVATPEDFVRSARPEVQGFLESQFITKEGSWERTSR